jgi:Ca-activated chloride channel homolog
MMTFLWPWMLFLLLLVPLLVFFYVRQQRRRRKLVAQYGSMGFAQGSAGAPGVRRHVPPALFLIALAILIVAVARPETVINLPRVEGTVILAFDVSGSMAADDMKPSRMDAAKAAARDFVQRQPRTVEIGIAAFSDNGFSVQTPTNDQDEILSAINRLSPQRGTSVANGILASLKAIDVQNQGDQAPRLYSNLAPTETVTPPPVPQGTYTNAVIILLSDGENNEQPNPITTAQTAADRGIRIYTVGLGSAAGVNLHINGFTVHTQLDEATLQQISQITGGTYYNAQSTEQLRSIYDNLTPQLVIKPERTEVTAVFVGASILVMLLAGTFSLLWFSRLP